MAAVLMTIDDGAVAMTMLVVLMIIEDGIA